MYPAPLQGRQANRQASIEVNEAGTEATAATVIGIGVTYNMSPAIIRLDRPFMYRIAE